MVAHRMGIISVGVQQGVGETFLDPLGSGDLVIEPKTVGLAGELQGPQG